MRALVDEPPVQAGTEAYVRTMPPPRKRAPDAVRFGGVVALATSAQLVLFALSGCFGVLAFPGEQVNGNVLISLESKPLGALTFGALALGVCLAGPLLVFPARASVATLGRLLGGKRAAAGEPAPPLSRTAHVALTAAIVGAALTIALGFDQLMVLVSYLGAFCLCPLGLAFPAIALLCLPPAGAAGGVQARSSTGAAGRDERLLHGTGGSYSSYLEDQIDSLPLSPRKAGKRTGCCGRGLATVAMCVWLVSVAGATVVIAIVNL